MNLKFTFFIFFNCIIFGLYGQIENPPSKSDNDFAFDAALKIYEKSILRNSHLFNGVEYVDHYRGVRGHQFYKSIDWEEGSIRYQNQLYDSVEMKYDIVNDLVIIGHFNENGVFSAIELITEKVDAFWFFNEKFIRVKSSFNMQGKLDEGFYKVIHEGDNLTLGRYKKNKEAVVNTNDRYDEFDQKNRYYVIVNGQVHPIGKKKSLINALPDKGKEIKAFIKKYKIKLKDNKEVELDRVMTYYDQLTSIN